MLERHAVFRHRKLRARPSEIVDENEDNTGSGMDVASILSSLAGGGVGGAVVMAIVGLIKAKMAKP
jgi:hypothetical protein